MSSSTAPTTPEQTVRADHPGVRRSFTVPTRSITSQSQHDAPDATPESVETLFASLAARVVSFSQPTGTSRPSSSSGARRVSFDQEQEVVGTLPWRSSTETIMAVGPLRIYRVPGSVSFLHSGDLLHPILPKSQCWCVDGESNFVIRRGQTSYYRIELPSASEVEQRKVEELKKVFTKVLQFETTACPFRRNFHVELPEPKPFVRKRPWRPPEKAKTWKLDEAIEGDKEENSASPLPWFRNVSSSEEYEGRSSPPTTDDELGLIQDPGSTNVELGQPGAYHDDKLKMSGEQEPPGLNLPIRPRMMTTSRSITAPPQLTLKASPPVMNTKVPQPDPDYDTNECFSVSSSVDSFHSMHTAGSFLAQDLDSSLRSGASAQDKAQKAQHQREISELTVIPVDRFDGTSEPSAQEALDNESPATPSFEDLPDDVFVEQFSRSATCSETYELHSRHPPVQRRDSQLLYSYSSSAPGHRFTPSIMQRTYEILMSPPSHLVALMLRIAANFAKSLRSPRKMRKVGRMAGGWDSGESDGEAEEDDFGIPLGRIKIRGTKGGDADADRTHQRESSVD